MADVLWCVAHGNMAQIGHIWFCATTGTEDHVWVPMLPIHKDAPSIEYRTTTDGRLASVFPSQDAPAGRYMLVEEATE